MTRKLVERAIAGNRTQYFFPQALAIHELGAVNNEIAVHRMLQHLQELLQLEGLTLMQGTKGKWRVLQQTGFLVSAASHWLEDVLDTETTQVKGELIAATIESPVKFGYVLIAKSGTKGTVPTFTSDFDALAAAFGLLLADLERRNQLGSRVDRLKALLDVTTEWNRTQNTDLLLNQICETSTRLLGAERATLFLIDRKRNQLIGKPATGVDGNEIVLPLNAGVVGQTVQTGIPQRVDADIASEQALIHRDVDQQLNFRTRTLICVPMKNSAGKIIGAFEIINKRTGNFDDDDMDALTELAGHAAISIENSQHVERLVVATKQLADQAQEKVDWIGGSPQINRVKHTIERVADTDLAILITGENGTGKEVAAQMLHYLSSRRSRVLVAVNCAAISETLLESELFGHEKGAFTDAHQTRVGKFELADGGTLFLDEIGDMSLSGQAKLLRVLEEKIVVRVGGSTPISTNTRVLAATNQNLAQLVREKRFREDLFFRLNVVSIEMPPLRDRGDDILQLAEHFLKIFAIKVRRKTPELSQAARKRLLAHDWPGNVRELRNMMERIAYLSTDANIDAHDLPFIESPRHDSLPAGIPLDLPLADATDLFQSSYIDQHIQKSHGNMTEAARHLGLHRSNLYRKMKQLGMDPD